MDWEEAYQKFDVKEPLKFDDPRLDPSLFGNFLETMVKRILLAKDKNQKLLLSGHVGCGKSTFLNLFQERSEIKESLFTVKYSIGDLLNINDTDHIDLLLSITLQTVITAQQSGAKIDKKLTEKLQALYNELKGIIARETVATKTKGRKTGAGAKAGISLKALIPWFKTDFFARYQLEHETRESIREYYKPRMADFLNTINDILTHICATLNKTLLVLIDDTDKIPADRALEIFLTNGAHLAKPLANIVFVIDTSLSCSQKYPIIKGHIGGEEFFPAIKVTEREGSPSTKNREQLAQLVRKRMEGADLIDEAALTEAVKMSGGCIRELVRIINEALFHARGKVHKDNVDYAVIRIRNSYNLYGPHVKILKAVINDPSWLQSNYHEIGDLEPVLLNLLQMPALFQYRNGEDKWYRPYPIFISWLDTLKGPDEKPL